MLAAILLVIAMMLMFLTGCNRQVIDTTFSYDNAILALPDGSVISGKNREGAGIFAGCYFGEGWYGPSPFSFLRSSDVLRKRKLDHGRTRS
jgi:hypothetical protein